MPLRDIVTEFLMPFLTHIITEESVIRVNKLRREKRNSKGKNGNVGICREKLNELHHPSNNDSRRHPRSYG